MFVCACVRACERETETETERQRQTERETERERERLKYEVVDFGTVLDIWVTIPLPRIPLQNRRPTVCISEVKDKAGICGESMKYATSPHVSAIY